MVGKRQDGPRSQRDLPLDPCGMDARDRWNLTMRRRRAEKLGLPLPPLPGESPRHDPAPFGLSVDPVPDEDLSAEEIVARRKAEFAQKRRHEEARKLLHAHIRIPGPIGILHFGDPHLDSPGCDLESLERDIHLVQRTEGLYAASIGDHTDNWVGRLARLANQNTVTARQAWKLCEWFIGNLSGKLVYLIAGNHDLFSGEGDPLEWIARSHDARYQASEARVQINFPRGDPVTVNARHDFSGHSQYSPVHGPVKAAHFGIRDDIVIAGHQHVSGYSPIKDPETGKVVHCLRVASYKIYDRFARDKGFRDQRLGPCVVTIIDPQADPLNRIQVFWDPVHAAQYLGWLRAKQGYAPLAQAAGDGIARRGRR